MKIRDATAADLPALGALLASAFPPHAFPLPVESAAEVLEHGFARVADDGGTIVGWIGALREYDGRVFELHPLAVAPARQGQGIGTALVRDLEAQVAARGGLTILLGTDDDSGATSLAGVDLYDDLPRRLAAAAATRHPMVFYRKLGYVVCGVVPDANGRGLPDILMAKRLASGR